MTTRTYLDRPSLWVVVITALLIVAIVTAGVLSKIFLGEFTARIVLVSLIILLSILGISALTFLELRRKAAQTTNRQTIDKKGYYYQNIKPSAPAESTLDYSNRSTVPAS
ncbi:hypothetical protein D910_04579 [Dendroctonus ponderosae]|uniref:Uncharacterized protein n=1 Tax=Dendroctonus ponderosae TaxID=77166 RepID=U4TZW5_DENPD|nr:hypothetical protein D910_04579 [Dendroctonus ponderosae]KAH1012309.1 hypothetical protein HUJ05_011489 [Dendroctonus ponderosae]